MTDQATPAEAPGRPRPVRRGYLGPGLIALAVLIIVAVVIDVVGLQHPTPKSLAGPDVATLIAQDWQTRTGSAQPPQIRCPPAEPVRAGLEFTCQLDGAGEVRTIRVHETTDRGTFTWILLPAAQTAG